MTCLDVLITYNLVLEEYESFNEGIKSFVSNIFNLHVLKERLHTPR